MLSKRTTTFRFFLEGERKRSITPGDARTFANSTFDSVLFCPVVVLCVFSLRYTIGESRMEPAPAFIFRQLTPRDAPPSVGLTHS